VETFWAEAQPGFRFTDEPVGTPAFYQAVESHRYSLEPHIPEIVQFDRYRGRDVLEVGCGIGTDAARFARAGASYTGVDATAIAIELAQERFRQDDFEGSFQVAEAADLPFPDNSFDLVYSHGVIHHIHKTEEAIAEMARVVRPGGMVLVMFYHRGSLNYRFTILAVRRILAGLLLLPGATGLISRLLGERSDVLDGQRQLLRQHGLRYLSDKQLFLNNNTDGPGNPLSKVYSRQEAKHLFERHFSRVWTEVRYLNLRLYPMGDRISASGFGRRLEQRIGWHLYVHAHL
jgi:SAM-dependent methyltransferase